MLAKGDYVAAQNGEGSHQKRWDKTGQVMQKLPFRQYHVKIDGSNRLTLRNRKFLRRIEPVCRHRPPPLSSITLPSNTQPVSSTTEPIPSMNNEPQPNTPVLSQPEIEEIPAVSVEQPQMTRRSNRIRRPREIFQASLQGKHHDSKTISELTT